MHPAFATIKFGPFKSEYHQAATADENFREALSDYLVAALLPQVDQSFDGSSGTLCATYDDQKYCGPNSAVRDLYTLEFAFHRVSGEDSIKAKLAYSPKERSFSVARRGLPLYLWTVTRKEAQGQRNKEIEALCERIQRGEISAAACPCCGAELRISNSAELFDVRCPALCFNYNFHRDPNTGAFQHGHFFSPLPR